MDGDAQEQLVSKIQYKNFEPGDFIVSFIPPSAAIPS